MGECINGNRRDRHKLKGEERGKWEGERGEQRRGQVSAELRMTVRAAQCSWRWCFQ